MAVLDWVVVAALAASVLLGLWRGLVFEVLSVLNWIAALMLAQWLAPRAAAMMPLSRAGESVQYAAGFVVVFIAALFASQDRWAFNRQANPMDELAKLAALAGLNRDSFNAVVADQGFRAAILKGQEEADKVYKVDSTPSFIFNGPGAKNRREAGGRTPDDFAKLVAAAAG